MQIMGGYCDVQRYVLGCNCCNETGTGLKPDATSNWVVMVI